MKRTVGIVLLATCVACFLVAEATAAPVLVKPGQKQLFLDGAVIAQLDGVETTMHQVEKCGAVIRPENPWEAGRVATRDAPLWNPAAGRWEYYYFAHADENDDQGRQSYTCLAVSQDGLNWEKPIVGLYNYNGSTNNNIVKAGLPTTGDITLFHVLYDSLDADANRRYKGFMGERNPLPAVSPDALEWTLTSNTPIPSGEASYLVYDKIGEQFAATLRYTYENRRAVTLSTSKDFINWTEPVLIYYANEQDQQRGLEWLAEHLSDPTKRQPVYNIPAEYDTQIYAMGAFAYEGVYVGLPTMFHHTGNNDGLSDVTLSVSRDLHNWSRVGNGDSFMPLSPIEEGVYDLAAIQSPADAVRRGDELWFYYSGMKYRVLPSEELKWDSGAICLAKLRLDGFVSADAGASGGTLLTQPLLWHGSRLCLNADADGGQIRVEVLDADGQPLGPEYSLDNAIPITGAGVRVPVQWQSGSNMRNLIGEKIRLRFHMENAGLYSFWSEGAQPVLFDNFEDGNYSASPSWTPGGGVAAWSVETDSGGSETLALKCVTSDRDSLLYSETAPDDSDAFEITLQEHSADARGRIAFQFGSLDGSNYVEFEWSGGSTGTSPRMDLYVQAGGEFEYLTKSGAAIGSLIPGDGVLHTVTLGRRADETGYVYVDDGSKCYLELKNSTAFSGALEQFKILVGSLNDAYPTTLFIDNIELIQPSELPGDANQDSKVDEADAYILAANWLYGPDADWGMGDFNDDGVVDDKDATLLAANWHVGVETATVPEPNCGVFLFSASFGTLLLWWNQKKDRSLAGDAR